jgi:hypothetical protein
MSEDGRCCGCVRAGLPATILREELESVAAAICAEGIPPARLRDAVDAAAATAFNACGRGDCDSCDRLWSELETSCERRQVRKLAKRLAQALLPLLRRGHTLDTIHAALDGAAARALGRGISGRSAS